MKVVVVLDPADPFLDEGDVAHEHVGGASLLRFRPHKFHVALKPLGVEPVVGVEDFDILSPGFLESGVDAAAVVAVGLVEAAEDAGPLPFPPPGDFAGLVLGAVVDDDHLQRLAPVRQTPAALVQIRLHVVRRHDYRQRFLHD